MTEQEVFDAPIIMATHLFMALFGVVYLLASEPMTPEGIVSATLKILVYMVVWLVVGIAGLQTHRRVQRYARA